MFPAFLEASKALYFHWGDPHAHRVWGHQEGMKWPRVCRLNGRRYETLEWALRKDFSARIPEGIFQPGSVPVLSRCSSTFRRWQPGGRWEHLFQVGTSSDGKCGAVAGLAVLRSKQLFWSARLVVGGPFRWIELARCANGIERNGEDDGEVEQCLVQREEKIYVNYMLKHLEL